jgi:hypothetical protein
MNIKELAERDLTHTLENQNASGSPFVLIDPLGNEYPLAGDVGDVSLLAESANGETFRSRTITAACRIKTLLQQTPLIPARGWQARVTDLNGNDISLYVQGVDPDRTLGLYNLTMGLDLEPLADASGEAEAETEDGNE